MNIFYDKQYDCQLNEIVKNNPRNFIKCIKSKGFQGRYENRQHLVDYIMRCTSLLVDTIDFTYSFKTRLYWTINYIQNWNDERVRCKVCGKPMMNQNIKKLHEGYKKTCCKECERKLAQQSLEDHLMKEHGVKNVFQLKNVIDKLNAHKDETQKRREETKRKNKTFKTSKKEDEAYQILCSFFSNADVIRQHKDEARYPFCCDFYIKSCDLFIECNFSWTHGRHWFDESSTDDVAMLEKWKSKKSKYYDNAIETWTVRDVKKRKCAEDNGLKYIVFWTLDEMKRHYSIA